MPGELFASPFARAGTYRLHPATREFHGEAQVNHPLWVFPRRSVELSLAGERPFVSSPAVVVFYNAGQPYRRRAIDHDGVVSDWFWVRADALLDALRAVDRRAGDDPARPFRVRCAPVDAGTYLLQRSIVRWLAEGDAGNDALAVEEALARLLRRVAAAVGTVSRPPACSPAHRELAARLKALLGRRLGDKSSLEELARELGCSPFYLARVFRHADGRTIHQYRLQLRLAHSLERVAAGESIELVAHELGFASHSHFTATFRQRFGLTPSQLRGRASRALLRSLLNERARDTG